MKYSTQHRTTDRPTIHNRRRMGRRTIKSQSTVRCNAFFVICFTTCAYTQLLVTDYYFSQCSTFYLVDLKRKLLLLLALAFYASRFSRRIILLPCHPHADHKVLVLATVTNDCSNRNVVRKGGQQLHCEIVQRSAINHTGNRALLLAFLLHSGCVCIYVSRVEALYTVHSYNKQLPLKSGATIPASYSQWPP